MDPGLTDIVHPGVLWLDQAQVRPHAPRLGDAMRLAEAAVRVHAPDDVASVRAMYRQVGIDPTRTRPSSEALLRRVRKGEPLPTINTMVDVCNWCSLETQLPFGLYDLDQVTGDVELRLGRDGEAYAGIRKDAVHVSGRLTVADAEGPFGNPTSDSARTMVTTATRRALVVVFAPGEVAFDRLVHALDLTADRMRAFTEAVEVGRVV